MIPRPELDKMDRLSTGVSTGKKEGQQGKNKNLLTTDGTDKHG
jgi:hypothetical protein